MQLLQVEWHASQLFVVVLSKVKSGHLHCPLMRVQYPPGADGQDVQLYEASSQLAHSGSQFAKDWRLKYFPGGTGLHSPEIKLLRVNGD